MNKGMELPRRGTRDATARRRRRGLSGGPRRVDRPNGSLAFLLCAVLGTGLLPIGDALSVENAADDVIAHAGQIAHPAAADKYDGVLLQVVPLTGDVGGDFFAVGQPDACDLSQRGV